MSGLADVAVVVVSWNTRELTARALASIPAEVGEVVVVDNASSDGSAELVRERFARARLVSNPSNRLFAAAVNQGLAATSAPYVLLLGSDAELLDDALARLVEFLATHPGHAAAAPRLIDARGATQRACMEFPRATTPLWFGTPFERWFPRSRELERYFARGFDHESDADVAQPPASALLLRRAALLRANSSPADVAAPEAESPGWPMDERLALYFNDVDLSLRLARAGWRTRYVASARVRHAVGASTAILPDRLERWHLDRLRFQVKHFGPLAAPWVKLCTAFAWIDFVVRGAFGRLLGSGTEAREPLAATTRAFLRFLVVPGLPPEGTSGRPGTASSGAFVPPPGGG